MTPSSRSLILYLPTLEDGGAERVQLLLAPYFIAAGYTVTFLLQRAEGARLSELPEGVRCISLNASRTLTSLRTLIRFLAKEKPDVLIANLSHNNLIAVWARMLARVSTRIVAVQHNSLSAECAEQKRWQYRILPYLLRFFLPRADAIVAVSHGVAEDLAATAHMPPSRVTVIHNPVIADDFAVRAMEPIRHAWLEDGRPLILGVGRLVPQKDFATLITAFAKLSLQLHTRLMLLGDGPLANDLRAQAEALGVADRVELVGFRRNPLPFMRAASLVVLSSRYEGFGNVLAEALACGTPVVSTNCPSGPSEILADGAFGRLIPPGDATALAHAIQATLAELHDKERLRRRGQEFSVRRAAEHYLLLLERIMRDAESPPA